MIWRVLLFTCVFGAQAIDIDLETYIDGKLFEPVDSSAELEKTSGIASFKWNDHRDNKDGLQFQVKSTGRIIRPCENIQNGFYKIRLAGHKFQYLTWKKEKLRIQRKSLQTFARSWRIYTLDRNEYGVSPILMQSATKPKVVGGYAAIPHMTRDSRAFREIVPWCDENKHIYFQMSGLHSWITVTSSNEVEFSPKPNKSNILIQLHRLKSMTKISRNINI